MIDVDARVLLIYTGGTIGMVENPDTGSLEPFEFHHLNSHIPEMRRLKFHVDHIVFTPTIDSSEVIPEHWVKMVRIIEENYNDYDGFVVLHGTDTMAYTASAISFMIENLKKPIVLTGSQLPIGKLRTDAKENLITALEIAADKDEHGNPIVPEVCVFFQHKLMRGNRSTKINADNFNAFKSYNYPCLARAGIYIRYQKSIIRRPDYQKETIFHYKLGGPVAILKLFPGIDEQTVRAILGVENLRGVILETYGAGNGPMTPWFLKLLKATTERGVVILNITQCQIGSVNMKLYETGQELMNVGIISGYDSTLEAAITKLMVLIGHSFDKGQIEDRMMLSLNGEITRPEDKSENEQKDEFI